MPFGSLCETPRGVCTTPVPRRSAPAAPWALEVQVHQQAGGLVRAVGRLDPSELPAGDRRLARALTDHGLVLAGDVPLFTATRGEADAVLAEAGRLGAYTDGIEVPEDTTVVDVGAHVGTFTLCLAAARPRARIVAVEPFPPSYDALRGNLALHGVDGVVTEHAAVGATPGVARIVGRRGASMLAATHHGGPDVLEGAHDRLRPSLPRTIMRGGWSPAVAAWAAAASLGWHFGPQAFDVPRRTLSDLLRRWGIDRVGLLKIDVEGAECDVLDGVADEDWPRVDAVAAEVERTMVDGFCRRLARHGFALDVAQDVLVAGPFGGRTVMVRARRPGATGGPVGAATVSRLGPAAVRARATIEALDRRARVAAAGGAHVAELRVDGRATPAASPWRYRPLHEVLGQGRRWAYGLDPDDAWAAGWWPSPDPALPAAEALGARLTADRVVDRLVRSAIGLPARGSGGATDPAGAVRPPSRPDDM